MKLSSKILIVILSIACTGFIVKNSDPIQDIVLKFQNYNYYNYQEVIYVHTDADLYYAGDVIWYGTRLLDAQDHTPTKLSKIVHLKVYNENNTELYHKKIQVKDGFGKGDLTLSDTLSTGVYMIQAYTEWMRNFGSHNYFHKEILVVNKKVEDGKSSENEVEKIDVSFFPEGGNLLTGHNNKIGFKAINQSGYGIDFEGFIVDQNQDTVKKISSYKFGMGAFEFEPKKNASYQLLVKKNGYTRKFKMPDSQKDGLIIQVDTNKTNNVQVNLFMSKSAVKSNEEIFLLAHCRGKVLFAAKGVSAKNSIINIPINKLNSGINQLIVFNQNGIPLAQRSVFIQPKIEDELSVKLNNTTYSPRSNIEFDITNTSDEDFSLTLSISDRPKTNSMNLVNHLLLTSDLKGYIEHPEYYFENTDSARYAVDNLMLTQGWVRYNWQDINVETDSLKSDFKYSAETGRGPLFRGKLVDKNTNNPVSDTLIILSSINEKPNFLFNRIEDNNELIFQLNEFYGEKHFFATVFGDKSFDKYKLIKTEDEVKLDEPFYQTNLNSELLNPNVELMKKEARIMDNYKIYNPEAFKNWNDLEHIDRFYLGQILPDPEEIKNLNDYVELNNIKEAFKELLLSAKVRNYKGKERLFVLASSLHGNSTFGKEQVYNKYPATLFLNGIPIFDEDYTLNELPYNMVDKIEVYYGLYEYANHEFNGFVSITTKDLDIRKTELSHAENSTIISGISVAREYYSPKYEVENPYADRTPDFRHLLYWEPNLKLNEDQATSVSFCASDVKGEFYINVEGISESGTSIIVNQQILVSNEYSKK